MPGEEIARTRINRHVALGERRTWDAWLGARMPRVANLLARPLWRLAPRSRLRRRALARLIAISYSAANRRDYDVLRAAYAPDVELIFPGDPGPDFLPFYRGREAVFDAYQRWVEGWGNLQRVPLEVIDCGDRLVVTVDEIGRGAGSGVVLGERVGVLFWFRDGSIVRQEEYRDWRRALEAVGLER